MRQYIIVYRKFGNTMFPRPEYTVQRVIRETSKIERVWLSPSELTELRGRYWAEARLDDSDS